MSRSEMVGAVRAATEKGTYVVAHAATSSSIRVGLEAGVRCFEHAYILHETTAKEMVDARAFLTPTLVVTHSPDWMAEAGFSPEAAKRTHQMAGRHLQSIAAAVIAGVSIVHGTDFPPSGRTDGTTLAIRELELLVEAGLAPVDSLRAASTTAARLLGISESAATIQVGARADLIGVSSNPLQSVSTLRSPSLMVSAGKVVKDKLPEPPDTQRGVES
jgi:imidazolonepropionase-like amidohydrolase